MGIEHTRADRLRLAENSRDERVAASRFVLRHARDRDDLHELLDALGLNAQPPAPASAKRADVPDTSVADAPINTRRTAS